MNVITRILGEDKIYKVISIDSSKSKEKWHLVDSKTEFFANESNESEEEKMESLKIEEETTIIFEEETKKLFFLMNTFYNQEKIMQKDQENLFNYILINGPFGNGKKTMLRGLMAKEYKEYKLIEFRFSSFLGKSTEEIDLDLTESIEENKKRKLVIAIYGIDYILDEEDKGTIRRMMISLDNLLQEKREICIVCTSRNKSLIESNLIRKFQSVELETPKIKERKQFINFLLKKNNCLLDEEKVDFISKKTSGFVVYDLVRLFKNSLYHSLSMRNLEKIEWQDLEHSLEITNPSQLRDFESQKMNLKWGKDIVGYQYVKNSFEEVIEWPNQHQSTYQKLVKQSFSGILLYGPSGEFIFFLISFFSPSN